MNNLASKDDLKFILIYILTQKLAMLLIWRVQAGVRYSIKKSSAYIDSNLVGFGNIIEESRLNEVDHFIYASSSSVYGNKKLPFK